MKLFTHNLGFPRIGLRRQLKKALESYWADPLSGSTFHAIAQDVQEQIWKLSKPEGMDWGPSRNFSFYGHSLATGTLVGIILSRLTD